MHGLVSDGNIFAGKQGRYNKRITAIYLRPMFLLLILFQKFNDLKYNYLR